MPGPGAALIGEEEIREVVSVLRSGYLSRYGPDDDPAFRATVYRLEQAVAQRVGVRHAVAVNSGTSALLCMFAALGIGPGDEVIVPGFTYVASISAIVYSRAVPVLAEIDESFNLDPADVERRITPRTKAILAVHMMGNPARLAELKDVADRHGVHLVEDCCQAFGATYRGRSVGTYGVAGAISFNVFKTITCGDGGMMITDDDAVYERAFAFHDQGHRPFRKGIEIGERPLLGLNFRMTELSGAVLLAQLNRLDEMRSRLRENKARMRQAISDIPGLAFRTLPDPDGDLATFLTLLMPSADIAAAVAADLGSKVVAESGWHVYNHMEHVLSKRTAVPRGCPFDCACTNDAVPTYSAGMLPATDAILARAVNVAIGVSDRNLGSAYGINIRSDSEQIETATQHLRTVLLRHLG